MSGALHLLCGKIGSGKSTLAARLAAETGGVVIAEDHWLSTLYPGEITSLEDFRRSSGRLRAAIAPMIVAMIERGLVVVLDFQANTIASRTWIRALGESAGIVATLHFLDTPNDECRARMHRRNASGTHPYHVDDATFDQFTAHFVAPLEDEGFAIVRYE